MNFTINHRDNETSARAGTLTLQRGTIETPVFMPVGTLATVKSIFPRDLREIGAEIVLSNTYHLMLRPGADLVYEFGGASNFMGWHGPMLTDSGGYQVFSLADSRKITAEGVIFRSHIDGDQKELTPESAVSIQHQLNADIIMALDICPPLEATHKEVEESLVITHDWARRCMTAKKTLGEKITSAKSNPPERWCREDDGYPFQVLTPGEQSLFPIVQGGEHLDLRTRSATALLELDAPGYAIGGVSVGEGPESMARVVNHTCPLLPDHKPRYLMGVGHPRDLLMGVAAGIDMFDCVLPTRNGRNGQALTSTGKLNLKNARFRAAREPIDEACDCYTCRKFTRAYIRHLLIAGEMLASQLVSLHNVRFLLKLMNDARAAIVAGNFRLRPGEGGCLEGLSFPFLVMSKLVEDTARSGGNGIFSLAIFMEFG